ncbi:MAG: hypothetical protein CMB73_05935 [Euryarchaeota archaeon]|nr:hypothetical protein [Euryarchaeota archaeon]
MSSCLPTGEAYSKLSVEIAQKYSCQNGGYTRVTRKGRRKGDSAQLASVEFSSSRNSAVLPN